MSLVLKRVGTLRSGALGEMDTCSDLESGALIGMDTYSEFESGAEVAITLMT